MIGPLFPTVKSTGRPPVDRRTVVEATAWRFRTGAVAGRAGAIRELEHDLQELQPVGRAGRVGAGAGVDAIARAAGRGPGLGDVDRLHDRARAPARCHPPAGHRGLCRTTGSSVTSRPIMPSVAPAAGWRPRTTWSATGRAARWHSSSPRGRPRTRACRPRRSVRSASPAPGVGPGPDRTGCSRTRGTPKANRAWLRERRIAATIPERDDQIAHRRKKP